MVGNTQWVDATAKLAQGCIDHCFEEGVGSLALFTWQYLRAVAYLAAEPFAAISMRLGAPLHQLTCFSAYAIMALGALGFASIIVSF